MILQLDKSLRSSPLRLHSWLSMTDVYDAFFSFVILALQSTTTVDAFSRFSPPLMCENGDWNWEKGGGCPQLGRSGMPSSMLSTVIMKMVLPEQDTVNHRLLA